MHTFCDSPGSPRCLYESPRGALYHLDLPLEFEGIRSYLSPWILLEKEGPMAVIDPGPGAVAEALGDSLEGLRKGGPDWILLTHIHLDHGGGVGHLHRRFPRARIWVPRGAEPFVASPGALARASVQTLGSLAEAYGLPLSVKEEILRSGEEDLPSSLSSLSTPGHAPWHRAFLWTLFPGETLLFCGDAAGMYYAPLGENPQGLPYLRPGTPHKFFFDPYMESLELMKAAKATAICYGHYGLTREPLRILELHREQMRFWHEHIARRLREEGEDVRMPCASCDASMEYALLLDQLTDELIRRDDLLWNLRGFSPDLVRRERRFLRNSVRGMAEDCRRSQEREAGEEEFF